MLRGGVARPGQDRHPRRRPAGAGALHVRLQGLPPAASAPASATAR